MTRQPFAASLMLRYCRGEREGFEELYASVAPQVFALLIEWTKDQQRAVSLLQLTFESLHASRSLYVEGADPVPWIIAMARSELALDLRRRASNQREKPAVTRRSGFLFSRLARSSRSTESLGPKAT